jgi:tetratricopeptide (TPR) repeat protein
MPQYAISLIVVVCITAFFIWFWKKQKVFLALWVYYVITLLPVLGLIQVGSQAAADRYTYLPSLGPFLLVGLGTQWIWNIFSFRKHVLTIFIISFILTTGLLSFLTIQQIRIWKDSLTLWNYELKIFPNDLPGAYFNRAKTYQRLGKYRQALDDFEKSIGLNPHYSMGYIWRGLLYGKLGKYRQAIQDFDSAIRIEPNDSDLYYNRGLCYKLIGNCQQAILDFNKAILLNPQNIDAHINREICYAAIRKLSRI